MRKHFQQMTPAEKAFTHGYLRQNAARALNGETQHFYDRATDRKFTIEDAVDALRGGLIVEIHNDKQPDIRALVRNQRGTCVVVSLKTFNVITVYYNAPDDKHETLNWAPYRWNQDLVQLVKSLREAA